MKIICRDLSVEDGIPGYIAHPDRKETGPGLMIVHHHYGVTGHLKSVVCNFAKLGYTTVVPDLYKLLGFADGVLTMHGEVEHIMAKKRALEVAATVPGIAGIIDRIRLVPATRP